MEDKIRQALQAKFPPESVKQRRGSFGKTISYVEGNAVIAESLCCRHLSDKNLSGAGYRLPQYSSALGEVRFLLRRL